MKSFFLIVVAGVLGTVVGGWALAVMAVNGYMPTKPTSFVSDAAAWVYATITLKNAALVLACICLVGIVFWRDRLSALRGRFKVERGNKSAQSLSGRPKLLSDVSTNTDRVLSFAGRDLVGPTDLYDMSSPEYRMLSIFANNYISSQSLNKLASGMYATPDMAKRTVERLEQQGLVMRTIGGLVTLTPEGKVAVEKMLKK